MFCKITLVEELRMDWVGGIAEFGWAGRSLHTDNEDKWRGDPRSI